MWYLLGLIVVAAVLLFVVLPLVRRRAPGSIASTPTSPAAERAEIYRELVELELDQRVGKIDEADYRALSEALLARAAALISQEDALGDGSDDAIEREIAAAREALRSTVASPAPEPQP